MDNIKKAIELALAEFHKENGPDAKLEDGDEFATILNDGVLIIGMEDREAKIKFLLGKPYFVDFSIGLIKDESEN